MIGTAIKKYAAAHGMTCDGGLAYGKVNGLHISLEDGSGVKILQIYLYPPSKSVEEFSDALVRVQQTLLDCDAKEYRLAKQNPVTVSGGRAVVTFHDNPGTMARIERYIDEVMPRIAQAGLETDACAYCGGKMDEICYTVLDECLLPVHPGCVAQMSAQVETSEAQPKKGSVAKGILGALLGAVIGAIPWAIVFVLGYVAGIVGLLIGYLSNFFYGKLGGKNSKARVVIVVIALILGVLLGQAAGVTAMFLEGYDKAGGQEALGFTSAQYVEVSWDQYLFADQTQTLTRIHEMFVENFPDQDILDKETFIEINWDDDYDDIRADGIREFMINLGMGLFFGVLGCWGLFAQLNKETRRRSVKKLK